MSLVSHQTLPDCLKAGLIVGVDLIRIHSASCKHYRRPNLAVDLIAKLRVSYRHARGRRSQSELHHLLWGDLFDQRIRHERIGQQAAVFLVKSLQLLRCEVGILHGICHLRSHVLRLFPLRLAIDQGDVVKQ